MMRKFIAYLLLSYSVGVYAQATPPANAQQVSPAASGVGSQQAVPQSAAPSIVPPVPSIKPAINPAAADPSANNRLATGRIVRPDPQPVVVQAPAPIQEEVKPEPPKVKKKPRPKLVGVEGRGVRVNSTLTHANVIRVTGDGTETALVSIRFPNRIATPFERPRVIDASNNTIQVDGSNLYVSPRTDEPFAIYITGDAPGDSVVSLTLMPREIPAQTLILQLDSNVSGKRVAKVESYTQQMLDMLRKVASGKTPEGYSEARMPNVVGKQDGLSIIPEMRYSGSWLDIYKYKVQNDQSADIELSETQFYQEGVKAVAIYPNTILRQGDTTTVFVVADKSMLDGATNNGK